MIRLKKVADKVAVIDTDINHVIGLFGTSSKVVASNGEIIIYDDIDKIEIEFEEFDGAASEPPVSGNDSSEVAESILVNYFVQSVDPTVQDYGQLLDEGVFIDRVSFEKFGAINNVTTGQPPVSIWFGREVYTGFPDTAEEIEIVSSSANDTDGGSGAQQVTISNLLDADYNRLPDVTVTLNGTTPVNINVGQTYLRCTRARVVLSGTSQANEGELTIRHVTTTTNIFAVMPPLAAQTQILQYTVPAGFTLYIDKVLLGISRSNGSAGSARIDLQAKELGTNTYRTFLPVQITTSEYYNSQLRYVLPEKTDIRTVVDSVSDNGTNIFGAFQGTLKDNSVNI